MKCLDMRKFQTPSPQVSLIWRGERVTALLGVSEGSRANQAGLGWLQVVVCRVGDGMAGPNNGVPLLPCGRG